MEDSRFKVSIDCSKRTEREVFYRCNATNTGDRDGGEVVRMYVGFKNSEIYRFSIIKTVIKMQLPFRLHLYYCLFLKFFLEI